MTLKHIVFRPAIVGSVWIPLLSIGCLLSAAEQKSSSGMNLALVAKATTSFVSGHETITALNDGFDPDHSDDKRNGAYGNWPQSGTQWVQYEWTLPISTNKMDVYWFDDHRGVRLPVACRLLYWADGTFAPVANASEFGLVEHKFNTTTFDPVTTTKLRLEFDSNEKFSTGLLEWRVYDTGQSPNFPPAVEAGQDRVAVLSGKTWLSGTVKDDGKPSTSARVTWSKSSGPGEVSFEQANAVNTTAKFSAVGDYVLTLTADDGQQKTSSTLNVRVEPAPPTAHLEPVRVWSYSVNSPLWNSRLKVLIVNWIPHCYTRISDPKLQEGGIINFVNAGNKLAGKSYDPHVGAVFANGWVYNTVEAMCCALAVDPQGDFEIIAAQKAIRNKLEDWIPKLVSAQEPDGYLHTCYTLQGHRRWSNRDDHEGYQAGYFIEAAIAHYEVTGRKDSRLYDAAKKLADCWCANFGPGKREWFDGHQAFEMALIRLADFVDANEGDGKGRKYAELAKFLLDCRRNGGEYDQSHLPVIQQYEAVGHAVRAVYSYAGMADVAMDTGDIDYHSAILSLHDNLVHKKYYVTGGVGSGETSEGFGKNYSLPNHAYCESCAGCGELFFQHRLNRAYHRALHADLAEETLFNAILGSYDLEGKHFTYTNSLDSSEKRYLWHVCPCCVGNIPRTLLSLPTWMYAKDKDGLYINLLAGSRMTIPDVAGIALEIEQETDYPWKGSAAITLNPAMEKEFSVRIRIPYRQTSRLYPATPAADGISSISINGSLITPMNKDGYAIVTRTWKKGDRIELTVPMTIQRIKSDPRIVGNVGRVALRYGPLIYNFESVDQNLDKVLSPTAVLAPEWRPDLLQGVMVIKGSFADGSPMMAIPNYSRLNRGGRSIVWIKDQ